ncbi:MAG TPA: hypothetical protein DCM68_04910 [Verrucomicrobia bacterium]|nr:hypothetical protein [Verrucomicrobiota bacterium]
MNPARLRILLAVLVCTFCAYPFRVKLRRPFVAASQSIRGKQTVADRVARFGDAVRKRLAPDFERIGAAYPPEQMALIGLKSEETLQVWVSGGGKEWEHLKSYPILGMSGTLGPKLKEGDRQVPEGIYRLESLNPNSLYHLALRVSYPNAEDVRRGRAEGRTELGGDIMIHGKDCSIGCLAMGDEAAEDLFVLAAQTGIDRVEIILSPVDFRVRDLPADRPLAPDWTPQLYESIRRELKRFEGPAGI